MAETIYQILNPKKVKTYLVSINIVYHQENSYNIYIYSWYFNFNGIIFGTYLLVFMEIKLLEKIQNIMEYNTPPQKWTCLQMANNNKNDAAAKNDADWDKKQPLITRDRQNQQLTIYTLIYRN